MGDLEVDGRMMLNSLGWIREAQDNVLWRAERLSSGSAPSG